jgi:hypothetical protein
MTLTETSRTLSVSNALRIYSILPLWSYDPFLVENSTVCVSVLRQLDGKLGKTQRLIRAEIEVYSWNQKYNVSWQLYATLFYSLLWSPSSFHCRAALACP